MTAVELLAPGEAVPSNPAWHELRRAGVTASEIAAVLGLSPWESPFSLYWRKVNDWQTEDSDLLTAGRLIEPAVVNWWQSQRMDLLARPAGLYASGERPWQIATPDRLVNAPVDDRPGVYRLRSLLECKWVAHSWDGWGEPGTDEVPVYYRAQAQWQLDVLEVDEVHIAALGPGGFRAYRVRRDERDLRIMRAAGERFMHRLESGDAPDVDEHPATARAMKALHPSVEDYDVEVPVALAEGYRRARALRDRIEARVDAYEARIRAAIGGGRRAMCNGKLVASRSVYDQSGDTAELTALETDWPTVNRLNPGRSKSYAC